MLAKKINKLVLAEMKTFFDIVQEKYSDVSSEDLYEDLKSFLEVNDSGASLAPTKPEKKKRVVKEVQDNERCLALKKDGGRCNGKQLKTDDSGLCSLHINSGPKFGIVSEHTDSEQVTIEPATNSTGDLDKIEVIPKRKTSSSKKKEKKSTSKNAPSSASRCCFVFAEGTKVGKECGKKTENGNDLCKLHIILDLPREESDTDEVENAFVAEQSLLVDQDDSDIEAYINRSDDD